MCIHSRSADCLTVSSSMGSSLVGEREVGGEEGLEGGFFTFAKILTRDVGVSSSRSALRHCELRH